MNSYSSRRIDMNGTIATLHPYCFDESFRTVDYGPSLKLTFRAIAAQRYGDVAPVVFLVGPSGHGKTEFARVMQVIDSAMIHVDPFKDHEPGLVNGKLDLAEVVASTEGADSAEVYVVDELSFFRPESVVEFVDWVGEREKAVVFVGQSVRDLPAIPEGVVLAFSRENGVTHFNRKYVGKDEWDLYQKWKKYNHLRDADGLDQRWW